VYVDHLICQAPGSVSVLVVTGEKLSQEPELRTVPISELPRPQPLNMLEPSDSQTVTRLHH